MTTVYKKKSVAFQSLRKMRKEKEKKKQLADKEYLQSWYFYLLYWRSYYI